MTDFPPDRISDFTRLRDSQELIEHSFHSDVPLLGPAVVWFRRQWNNVSTTWYVRTLIDQQNRFNALVVDQLADYASRIEACETKLEDLYAWLVQRDHEESGYVRDLAEVTLQLVQLRREFRELGDLTTRPEMTESLEDIDGQ